MSSVGGGGWGGRRRWRLLAFGVGCAVCAIVVWLCLALASDGRSAAGGYALAASVGEGLHAGVAPTDPSPLFGGQLVEDERLARLASPAAVTARAESATAYAHISVAGASKLARTAFAGLVDRPAAGPPALSHGERIAKFIGAGAARVRLSDGRRAVVESVGAPMAMETAGHKFSALNLSLKKTDGDFVAVAAPGGGVPSLPGKIGEGVSLPVTGVSLTPATKGGTPLSGAEGSVDGASVFDGRTEDPGAGVRGVSTLVKPGLGMVEMTSLLLTASSSERLFYRVGMPVGAQLVQQGSGAVQVRKNGVALAVVEPPVAHDVEGTPVPDSMRIAGPDVLEVNVAHPAGAYRMPIAVDPTARDYQFDAEEYYPHARWRFTSSGPDFTAAERPEHGSIWAEHVSGSHGSSESAGLEYATQGESEIVEARIEGHWDDAEENLRDYLNLYTPGGGLETRRALPTDTEERYPGQQVEYEYRVCAPSAGCEENEAVGAGGHENAAEYLVEAAGSGTGVSVENLISYGTVEIAQEKGPEVSFNTTSPTLREADGEYVPNALDGGDDGWLSPHSAVEVHVHDPGTGIADYRLLGFGGWGGDHP